MLPPNCKELCPGLCWFAGMGFCSETLSNLPSLGLGFGLGSSPHQWSSWLWKVSEVRNGRGCERKHKDKCESRTREVKASLSQRWRKENVCGMHWFIVGRKWKELLITAKWLCLINALLCIYRKAEVAVLLSKRYVVLQHKLCCVTTQISDKVKWWIGWHFA